MLCAYALVFDTARCVYAYLWHFVLDQGDYIMYPSNQDTLKVKDYYQCLYQDNGCDQEAAGKEENMSLCAEQILAKYLLNEQTWDFQRNTQQSYITSKQQVNHNGTRVKHMKTVFPGRGVNHIRLYFLTFTSFASSQKETHSMLGQPRAGTPINNNHQSLTKIMTATGPMKLQMNALSSLSQQLLRKSICMSCLFLRGQRA